MTQQDYLLWTKMDPTQLVKRVGRIQNSSWCSGWSYSSICRNWAYSLGNTRTSDRKQRSPSPITIGSFHIGAQRRENYDDELKIPKRRWFQISNRYWSCRKLERYFATKKTYQVKKLSVARWKKSAVIRFQFVDSEKPGVLYAAKHKPISRGWRLQRNLFRRNGNNHETDRYIESKTKS